jgi:hypothetical protein
VSEHTPGPWMVLPANERGQFVILTEHGPRLDIAETYGWPDTPRAANARLIAEAPAQAVVLRLLQLGLARFEPGEFCFNGLRFSQRGNSSWSALVAAIGWDAAHAAIAAASEPTP